SVIRSGPRYCTFRGLYRIDTPEGRNSPAIRAIDILDSPVKKVYATTVIGQAEMLQVVLRNYGIESRLENEGGAQYAVGLPTAAVPIVIVVDDERAEEAARIIADEFKKPRPSDPTAILVALKCSCGKTLEYPKGEDPPEECPWCGRPTQF